MFAEMQSACYNRFALLSHASSILWPFVTDPQRHINMFRFYEIERVR